MGKQVQMQNLYWRNSIKFVCVEEKELHLDNNVSLYPSWTINIKQIKQSNLANKAVQFIYRQISLMLRGAGSKRIKCFFRHNQGIHLSHISDGPHQPAADYGQYQRSSKNPKSPIY